MLKAVQEQFLTLCLLPGHRNDSCTSRAEVLQVEQGTGNVGSRDKQA